MAARFVSWKKAENQFGGFFRRKFGLGWAKRQLKAKFQLNLMTDTRYKQLAKLLVGYSTELKKGDKVLVDVIDVPDEFTVELIRAAREAGGVPIVETRHTRVSREILLETDTDHANLVRDLEMFRMKKMQAYIAIRGSNNA